MGADDPQVKEKINAKIDTAKGKEKPAEGLADEAAKVAPTQTPDQVAAAEKLPALDRYLKEDENKNLVLDDGTIIAASGKARTFFERVKREGREQREAAKRMAVSNLELGNKFKELFGKYNEALAKPRMDLATETGLSETDVTASIDLMKSYKADPIAAVKKLLTQMHMNGINISTLGVGSAIDPATVKETLTSIVTDMLAKKAQADTPANQPMTAESAAAIATKFLNDYPEAAQYEEQIAKAKTQFPDMELDEIWMRFSAYLARQPEKAVEQYRSPQPSPQARQTPAPVTRRVTSPNREYANMSFEQIAQSIREDFKP
jgi:hypothetical protein